MLEVGRRGGVRGRGGLPRPYYTPSIPHSFGPTLQLVPPPDFQTFRHPWTDRHLLKKLHLQMSQLTKHLSSTYQLVPTNVFINVEFWVCQTLLIQFTNYRTFASSNTSRLEAQAGFIRLLMNYSWLLKGTWLIGIKLGPRYV